MKVTIKTYVIVKNVSSIVQSAYMHMQHVCIYEVFDGGSAGLWFIHQFLQTTVWKNQVMAFSSIFWHFFFSNAVWTCYKAILVK